MPSEPADSLSPEQERALGAALVELAARLEAALDQSQAGSRPVELDQTKMGRVSRIDAIQQQEMSQAAMLAQRQRLGRVRRALEALGRGEYGECVACEEPIGYRRLSARPESTLCIDCQRSRESR